VKETNECKSNSPSLESLVWQQYQKAGGCRDNNDACLNASLNNLAQKAEYLLDTGCHSWAKKRLADLYDFANWHAYEMEIHFTHALETQGRAIENSARRMANENSDIDLVHNHINGVEVRAECVFIQTPDRYWTEEELAPGLTIFSAFYSGEEEFFPSRMAQSKIRYKTIRKDGKPTKFPVPGKEAVQLVICDVTKGFGHPPDYLDLQLLTQGRNAIGELARRDLLGLFEPINPYGSKFDAEFVGNHYLRERIHCILFLMDDSIWRSSLDPNYTCCFLINPLLARSNEQIEAFETFINPLFTLMPRRLTGQKRVQQSAT
jgi:hypothetical protein